MRAVNDEDEDEEHGHGYCEEDATSDADDRVSGRHRRDEQAFERR